MKKELFLIKKTQGFSLVESILTVALFAMFVAGFSGALVYGQEGTRVSGNRDRAYFLAYEGLEAVRSIRDQDFNSLTNGTHGLAESAGVWSFSGSSDTTDIYTRDISISDVDTNVKEIESRITWNQNAQRTGEISLVSYLSYWLEEVALSGLVFNTDNISLSSANRRLQGIEVTNLDASNAVEITSITITWSGSSATNIQRVNLGGGGSEYQCAFPNPLSALCPESGDEISISYIIPAGDTIELNDIRFFSSFSGATFSILLKTASADEYLLDNVSI